MSTSTIPGRQRAQARRPADATRERILRAAARLLASEGYARTHLQAIAASAGLKAPGVYHYFPSREALIGEVLREGQVRVRQHVVTALEALPAGSTARTKVGAVIDAHLKVQLELSDFALAVVRTLAHVPPEVRALVEPEVESYHQIWRGLLDEAARDGSLRHGLDPSMARMLSVGALNWAAEWHDARTPVQHVVDNARLLVGRALFD
jgi:AcrR family transcriptional regulator